MSSYGPAIDNDSRMITADGVAIVDGGMYWNYYDCEYVTVDGVAIVDGGMYWNYYDCEYVTVEFGDSLSSSPNSPYWDGWFEVRNADSGKGYRLNGERLSVMT
jgi:hypothetical protein